MRAAMSADEYSYLQRLVLQRTSNVLDPGTIGTTHMRLTPILAREGLATVSDLVNRLRQTPHGPLHLSVLDSLMVQESSFFRDPPVWEALRDHILPTRIRAAGRRPFRVWNGATALGQEPWSTAMLLKR